MPPTGDGEGPFEPVVAEVRDQERDGSLLLHVCEILQRGGDVCAAPLGLVEEELPQDPQDVATTLPGRDEFLDVIRENDEPNLVVVLNSAERQERADLYSDFRLESLPRPEVAGSAHVNEEHHGELGDLLDELGAEGVLQLLVEGGAEVAGRFHRAGLVDRYVLYVAPALLGGEDGRALMAGCGAPTMTDVWRGTVVHLERLGDDIRIDVTPSPGTD